MDDKNNKMMDSNESHSEINADQPVAYQIRIKGHLKYDWSDWFGDLSIVREADGDTLLTGMVIDQAALYGLLKKVRNAGMLLLSVNSVHLDQVDESHTKNKKETR